MNEKLTKQGVRDLDNPKRNGKRKQTYSERVCRDCRGRGHITILGIEDDCPTCRGDGIIMTKNL